MNHLIVGAHPAIESFTMALSRAYAGELEALGHTQRTRDLYRMGFDPVLAAHEILPVSTAHPASADVVAAQDEIRWADALTVIYPLWWLSMPAMMKGYFERVFGMGFAYGPGADGNQPLLQGRKMVSIGSSGAPKDWVVKTGDWFAVHKLFDEHFAAVCCLSVVDHLHFGEIEPGIRADVVEACATKVATMFETRFARAKSSAPAC